LPARSAHVAKQKFWKSTVRYSNFLFTMAFSFNKIMIVLKIRRMP
jgi:hypothetical protein